VDTDTAWFTMPMLNTGSKSLPWRLRGWKYVAIPNVTHFDLNTTGDVAWSDTDCTANTDPLAVAIMGWAVVSEANGTAGSTVQIGHSDAVMGADNPVLVAVLPVVGTNSAYQYGGPILCDDSQVIRYQVAEQDADSDVRARFIITGYWMWE